MSTSVWARRENEISHWKRVPGEFFKAPDTSRLRCWLLTIVYPPGLKICPK